MHAAQVLVQGLRVGTDDALTVAQAQLQADASCCEYEKREWSVLFGILANQDSAKIRSDIKQFCNWSRNRNGHFATSLSLFRRCMCSNSDCLAELSETLGSELARSDLSDEVRGMNLCEAGWLSLQCHDYSSALKHFVQALTFDGDTDAFLGMIHAKHALGQAEEAMEQLEFIRDTQSGIEKSSHLHYLSYLLLGDVKHLELATDAHISTLRSCSAFSHESFLSLNAPLFIQIGARFLDHTLPERAVEVSEIILEYLPRHAEAQLLMAESKYALGDRSACKSILQQMHSPASVAATLLLARISVEEGDWKRAAQLLGSHRSQSSEFHSYPIFWLVKAEVAEKQTRDSSACIPILLSGLKECIEPLGCRITQFWSDKLEMVIRLTNAYISVEQYSNGLSVLSQVDSQHFPNTDSQDRIHYLRAQLYLSALRIDEALAALELISSESPHYSAVIEMKLTIFAKHRRNRKAYIECLTMSCGGVDDWERIGDGFLRVSDIDDAIRCFESALEGADVGGRVVVKLGKSLELAREYDRAIGVYLGAIAETGVEEALIDLYVNLGQFEEALGRVSQAKFRGRFGICGAAFAATQNDEWIRIGSDIAKTAVRSCSVDSWRDKVEFLCLQGSLCCSSATPQLVAEGVAAYEHALRFDKLCEPAIVAISTIRTESHPEYAKELILRLPRDGRSEALLSAIHDEMERRQVTRLMDLPVEIDEGNLELFKNPPVRIREWVLGMYRLGRLRDVLGGDVGGGGREFMRGLVACYGRDTAGAVAVVRSGTLPVACRNVLVLKLVHLSVSAFLIDGQIVSENVHQLFNEMISPTDDATKEDYAFYASCLDQLAGKQVQQEDVVNPILAAFLESVKLKYREKKGAKNALKIIHQTVSGRDVLTETEFVVTETALLILAVLYLKKKQYEKAQKVCEFLCKISRGCGKAWMLLGRAYAGRGHLSEAAAALDACEQLGEVNSEASELLTEICYKRKAYFATCERLMTTLPISGWGKPKIEMLQNSLLRIHTCPI